MLPLCNNMLSTLSLQPRPTLLLRCLLPHRLGISERSLRKLYGLSAPDFFSPRSSKCAYNRQVHLTRSDFSKDWNTEESFVLVATMKVCYARFTLILPPEITFI